MLLRKIKTQTDIRGKKSGLTKHESDILVFKIFNKKTEHELKGGFSNDKK